MYNIIKNNRIINAVSSLIYIKQSDNGTYIDCPKEEALGISVNNTPYNLLGKGNMEGLDSVEIIEDDGSLIASQNLKDFQMLQESFYKQIYNRI